MTVRLLLVLPVVSIALLPAQWYDVRTAPWPPPRTRASFAYDLANGRCVMFGGVVQNGPLLDDTWTTQIPNDGALVGAEVFLTGVSFDDVNAFGAVLSRPLQLLVGR